MPNYRRAYGANAHYFTVVTDRPSDEGQRVAMRQGAAVYYLYGDHLPPAGVLREARPR